MHRRARTIAAIVLLGLSFAGCGGEPPEDLAGTRLPHIQAPLDTLEVRPGADTVRQAGDLEPLSEGAAAVWDAEPPDPRLPAPDRLVYSTYENAAFNYQLIYPDTLLKPTEEVGGNRGQEFASPDGSVRLLVYAAEGSVEEFVDQYQDELDNPEMRVTYHVLQDDWYAIAGVQGDWKIYEKALLDGGTVKTFRIQYEAAYADYFDAVAATIATNFNP